MMPKLQLEYDKADTSSLKLKFNKKFLEDVYFHKYISG